MECALWDVNWSCKLKIPIWNEVSVHCHLFVNVYLTREHVNNVQNKKSPNLKKTQN